MEQAHCKYCGSVNLVFDAAARWMPISPTRNDTMNAQKLAEALKTSLFRHESNRATLNAYLNLSRVTHYVDPTTLRFHHSRVLSARPVLDGTFFLIVESCALDYENTERGFRAVLFDLMGNAVYRPKLEQCRRSRNPAVRDYEKWLGMFDPVQHYAAALRERAAEWTRAIEELNTAATDLLAA